MLPVYLNHITDQLERKEAHTDGQDDMERAPTDMEAHRLQQTGKRFGEEVQVLEIQQDTDAENNGQRRDS